MFGYLIWGLWLMLFLALELLGLFGLAPWSTLSSTIYSLEAHFPFLREIITGFLGGLVIHLVTKRNLGVTFLAGLVAAISAHFGLGWP